MLLRNRFLCRQSVHNKHVSSQRRFFEELDPSSATVSSNDRRREDKKAVHFHVSIRRSHFTGTAQLNYLAARVISRITHSSSFYGHGRALSIRSPRRHYLANHEAITNSVGVRHTSAATPPRIISVILHAGWKFNTSRRPKLIVTRLWIASTELVNYIWLVKTEGIKTFNNIIGLYTASVCTSHCVYESVGEIKTAANKNFVTSLEIETFVKFDLLHLVGIFFY